jgi:hypothetical protein
MPSHAPANQEMRLAMWIEIFNKMVTFSEVPRHPQKTATTPLQTRAGSLDARDLWFSAAGTNTTAEKSD